MYLPRLFLTVVLSAAFSGVACARPVNIGGVKLDEAINLRDTPLLLNGAGIRYKATHKIYVAGLYLNRKTTTAEDVLSNPGPKRISLTMLRAIDADELGNLFIRGIEDNFSRSDMPYLVAGLAKMGQVFADQAKLRVGDVVLLEWVPGTGTILTVKGKFQAEFKEPEFFAALLRIWLGQRPVDLQLKDALLGKAPRG